MRALLFLLLSCLATTATAAGGAQLRDLRLWDSPEGTRVVFELDRVPGHKVFTLDNPTRIVIDLPFTQGLRLVQGIQGKGEVRSVRAAEREDGSLRVVLDMARKVEPRVFVLDPAEQYGHRLVLDMPVPEGQAPVVVNVPPAGPPLVAEAFQPRPIIVAIDAGHGGEDPGAIGPSGLQEKNVALDLARRLARLVSAEPGFRAVLTRDGDYYLGLRERMNRARKVQADLFVSVHANAVKDSRVRGSAVYVVSPRGASSEHARWLAQRENAADLVGGIGLENKDDELAAVLIDLSQSSTMEASFDVGGRMLTALSKVNQLQRTQVQQAAFVVLKSPDIPSVLVETAFITNPSEEKLLRSDAGKQRLAKSMFDGIKGYFESYRPRDDGRTMAQRGDAQLKKVSLE